MTSIFRDLEPCDPASGCRDQRDIAWAQGRSTPTASSPLCAQTGAGRTRALGRSNGMRSTGWNRPTIAPKPDSQAAFDRVFGTDGFDTTRAAMFEDDPRNLEQPHAMGLRTIHVAPAPVIAPYIGDHTPDLTAFLSQLV